MIDKVNGLCELQPVMVNSSAWRHWQIQWVHRKRRRQEKSKERDLRDSERKAKILKLQWTIFVYFYNFFFWSVGPTHSQLSDGLLWNFVTNIQTFQRRNPIFPRVKVVSQSETSWQLRWSSTGGSKCSLMTDISLRVPVQVYKVPKPCLWCPITLPLAYLDLCWNTLTTIGWHAMKFTFMVPRGWTIHYM